MEKELKSKRYVVTVDAICGRGQTLSRGETLLAETWEDYVEQLLEMGAIKLDTSPEIAVEVNRFMLR